MTHWADNYATVGRIRSISTTMTEAKIKSAVKTEAHKTNNQASFGGSLLKNNMQDTDHSLLSNLCRPGAATTPSQTPPPVQ
jgi:hypothetical protein